MADGRDAERRIDPAERAFLREMRWREDARSPRRMRVALLVVLVVHVLFVLLLRDAMRARDVVYVALPPESVLEISFVEPEPLPPAVREPVPATPATSAPATRVATVPARPVATPVDPAVAPAPVARPVTAARPVDRPMEMVVVPTPPADAPKLNLFDHNGGLKLSQEVVDAADARPQPLFRERVAEMPAFMTRRPPVRYKPTRFDAVWIPRDENIVNQWFREMTAEKTFRTPWGSKIKCLWIVFLGGCSFGIADTPLKNPPRGPGEVYEEIVKPLDPEAGW